AAEVVHRRLGGEDVVTPTRWAPVRNEVVRFERINVNHAVPGVRPIQPHLPVEARLAGYDEVVAGLHAPHDEAKRCLTCGSCTGCDNCYTFCPEPAVTRQNGVYEIHLDYCKGCGICFEECPRGVIDMVEERV
ncbi:MAG: 4Fe-4S dicluster domain-containing protein, partial [Myxococcota bacterium]